MKIFSNCSNPPSLGPTPPGCIGGIVPGVVPGPLGNILGIVGPSIELDDGPTLPILAPIVPPGPVLPGTGLPNLPIEPAPRNAVFILGLNAAPDAALGISPFAIISFPSYQTFSF